MNTYSLHKVEDDLKWAIFYLECEAVPPARDCLTGAREGLASMAFDPAIRPAVRDYLREAHYYTSLALDGIGAKPADGARKLAEIALRQVTAAIALVAH